MDRNRTQKGLISMKNLNRRSALNLALVFVVLLASGLGMAQNNTVQAVNQGDAVPRGAVIPGPGDVLWDNTAINNTTAGIVSTAFSSLPAGADRTNTADDFVIPVGETWTIGFVYSEGFSNLAVDVDSFEVVFYADNGGSPGAVLSSESVAFGGAVTMTTQELTLSAPVVLSPGTYWVSVVGTYDTGAALADGRWNWSTGPGAIGSEWFLQDTAGFFGGLPWTAASGLGIADVSALFALRGSVSVGTPPPETQPVPTLSNLGLILLSLMLAGLALVAIRVR
jgi:hypothetical protein